MVSKRCMSTPCIHILANANKHSRLNSYSKLLTQLFLISNGSRSRTLSLVRAAPTSLALAHARSSTLHWFLRDVPDHCAKECRRIRGESTGSTQPRGNATAEELREKKKENWVQIWHTTADMEPARIGALYSLFPPWTWVQIFLVFCLWI